MKTSFTNTIRIRNAVRVLSLAAFVALALTGRVKLWMGLFALGVVASFFAGRVYCGWICPMNSVMQGAGKKRFRGIFGSKGHPGKQGKSLPDWVRIIPLLLFIATFVGVQRFGIKLSPLLPLTLLSLPFAFLFGERIWHDSVCPFGTILSLTSRLSEKRAGLKVNPELCTACGACERVCPSHIAIEKTPAYDGEHGGAGEETKQGKLPRKIADRNCLQCYSCASVCPTDAINSSRLSHQTAP